VANCATNVSPLHAFTQAGHEKLPSHMKHAGRVAATAAAFVIAVSAAATAIWMLGREDMLATMMADSYGSYDAGRKVWVRAGSRDNSRVYRICAQQEVDVRGENHVLLAVCGNTAEMDSHATSGTVDLYVLRGDRREFTVAAQTLGVESGSFGRTGSVSVMKLGPSFYGFAVEDGWAGQGYTLETLSLYAPRNDALKETLSIRIGTDNSGTGSCGDADNECNVVVRKVSADESAANESVYPLNVVQSGKYDGRDMDGTFRLAFDRKNWTYRAPKGLNLMIE
jgi:hypothetical protein